MNSTNWWPAQPKKRQTTYANDSIIESLRALGSGVGKTVTRDVVGKVGTDALTSLFGSLPKQGELRPNQAIDLQPQPKEAPMPFIKRPEYNPKPLMEMDQAKVAQELQAVRAQLKAISASLKNLNQDIVAAISEVPTRPGVYHLNFMERLRSMLQILQEQIEDSRSWLALSTNKKKKKQFWGMYKKHGTQFGLSSERTLATQAG